MEGRFMKPIRGERKQFVIHDPWGVGERVSQQSDVSHFLSDSGELISCHVDRQIAHDCGCVGNPPGGFFVDCVFDGTRGLTCASCFTHCHCGRPICRGHSGFICFEDDTEIQLCGPCFKAERKRLRTMKISCFLFG